MTQADTPNLVAKAVEARQTGHYDESVALLEQALAAGESPETVYFQMGNTFVDAGKLAEAEDAYRRVLALNPEHHKALHNLGVVCHRQGRLDESVRHRKRAAWLELRGAHVAQASQPGGKWLPWVRLAGYVLLGALTAYLLSRLT